MSSERLLRINNSRVRTPNPEDREVRGGRGCRKSKRRQREGAAGVGRAEKRRVFNAASLGATRITKVKKEVFNNFSFSLYLLSHVS